MNELWKDIPDYEGLYQISNHGRVKSLSRTILKGGIPTVSKDIYLKPKISKGYYRVALWNAKTINTYMFIN